MHDVTLAPPAVADRRRLWRRALHGTSARIDDSELDALAERFRLYPSQVRAAVADAGGTDSRDLFESARDQTGAELGGLAVRVKPARGWRDIAVSPQVETQLGDLTSRAAGRNRVLDDWGFAAKLSRGTGLTALFAGPSGTGKTLAAEVVAHDLGLYLYELNLAAVVSKWIGETEKNLDRIFDAAERTDAVLLLDEADALLGKRSQGVHDALDRYSNFEVAHLLQKLERFSGIALLATNLAQNIDQAFTRRLAFTIHFPVPAKDERRRIWELVWPQATPRDADLDLDALAERFKLTGAGIRTRHSAPHSSPRPPVAGWG